MVAKDVNNGIHGLFPCATAAGRFPVSLAVNSLFVTNLALNRGVQAPHEMVLATMKSIAPGEKTGVILHHEGFGPWPS